MSLTVYTKEGLPKLPLGPMGPMGPVGPQGPGMKWWQRAGDNAGDGSHTSNTTWGTAKSPEFTVPYTHWYRVWTSFAVSVGANGTTVSGAVLTDGTAIRMLPLTLDSGEFAVFTMHPGALMTEGQKVQIGYRPVVLGRAVTLVNSGGVIPIMIIEEADPPS